MQNFNNLNYIVNLEKKINKSYFDSSVADKDIKESIYNFLKYLSDYSSFQFGKELREVSQSLFKKWLYLYESRFGEKPKDTMKNELIYHNQVSKWVNKDVSSIKTYIEYIMGSAKFFKTDGKSIDLSSNVNPTYILDTATEDVIQNRIVNFYTDKGFFTFFINNRAISQTDYRYILEKLLKNKFVDTLKGSSIANYYIAILTTSKEIYDKSAVELNKLLTNKNLSALFEKIDGILGYRLEISPLFCKVSENDEENKAVYADISERIEEIIADSIETISNYKKIETTVEKKKYESNTEYLQNLAKDNIFVGVNIIVYLAKIVKSNPSANRALIENVNEIMKEISVVGNEAEDKNIKLKIDQFINRIGSMTSAQDREKVINNIEKIQSISYFIESEEDHFDKYNKLKSNIGVWLTDYLIEKNNAVYLKDLKHFIFYIIYFKDLGRLFQKYFTTPQYLKLRAQYTGLLDQRYEDMERYYYNGQTSADLSTFIYKGLNFPEFFYFWDASVKCDFKYIKYIFKLLDKIEVRITNTGVIKIDAQNEIAKLLNSDDKNCAQDLTKYLNAKAGSFANNPNNLRKIFRYNVEKLNYMEELLSFPKLIENLFDYYSFDMFKYVLFYFDKSKNFKLDILTDFLLSCSEEDFAFYIFLIYFYTDLYSDVYGSIHSQFKKINSTFRNKPVNADSLAKILEIFKHFRAFSSMTEIISNVIAKLDNEGLTDLSCYFNCLYQYLTEKKINTNFNEIIKNDFLKEELNLFENYIIQTEADEKKKIYGFLNKLLKEIAK
ncbi:MAG: hypothetical protein KA885_07230 [Spirochaetes bacterium]|nr:hypothetical protein [Spirochaetota bacterium]